MTVTTHTGEFSDGTPWKVRAPEEWNETLLLYSHGPIYPPGSPAWPDDIPIVGALLERGYAVAGCGTLQFWPLEENVPHQMEIVDMFDDLVGTPKRRICWGESIGGLMTATIVQRHGERFDGALPLCGPLAGGVATQNNELDCTFVFKTLLAPDSELDVVHIKDPASNLQLALSILEDAQRTAEGRARLSFAASVMNIPGWLDPATEEPAKEDFDRRQGEQAGWLRGIDLMVFTMARAFLEKRAGGNPSWTEGVDYGDLLERSVSRDLVVGLYDKAGLDLHDDVGKLARSPRIAADAQATKYFEENIVFNGALPCPVMSVETTGDGLCTADHQHAYRDVAAWAGNGEQLRQLYVRRGGHCSFTPAEVLVGLDCLEQRIERGAWQSLDPGELNAAAAELGSEVNRLAPTVGALDLDRSGVDASAQFCEYSPAPFLRPYDARQMA